LGQRVAVYCRVSTSDQSCERQERDLAAFAARSGYEVVSTFKETGSGVKLDRAERRKVMALAQARQIDAVLVTELSRWGRSTTDLLGTLKELEARHVSVIALNGMAFDLSTPHGRMIATVLAGIAEFERELIQERIRSGIAAAQARGKRLGRQPGQRPKSDRLAAKVLALVKQGRSYRLTAREVGLSKNTVADIIRRSRATGVALLLLLATSPAWAQVAADETPQTRRACVAIAALANRGANALRGQDLVDRDVSVDLRNDGHPRKIREYSAGSAGTPYLGDEQGEEVPHPSRDDFSEASRWASDIAVLRIEQRFWEVDWIASAMNGSATLLAATDGVAICLFHSETQPPTVTLFTGTDPNDAPIYSDILMGRGAPAPSVAIDAKTVEAAWQAPHQGYSLGTISWRVDLTGANLPTTLVQVEFNSGAGAGCGSTDLALVQNGEVTAIGLAHHGGAFAKPLIPLSPNLDEILNGPYGCKGIVETPVMGSDNQAYVLISNTDVHPTRADPIRLLAGARGGVMYPLARLLWGLRNDIVSPTKP